MQQIEVDTTALYTVWATDKHGCASTDSIYAEVFPLPEVDLGNDTAFCANNILLLDAGYGAAYTYSWNTTDSLRFLEVDTTGYYSVNVADTLGCMQSDSIYVTVYPLPDISLGNDTAFCFGNQYLLTPGPDTLSYVWQDNSTQNTYLVQNSGLYYLTASNDFGCYSTDSVTVTVWPLPDVYLGNDIFASPGEVVTLSAGNIYNSYLWNTGDTTFSITVNTQQTGNGWFTYELTVTDVMGCSNTDAVQLVVETPPAMGFQAPPPPSGSRTPLATLPPAQHTGSLPQTGVVTIKNTEIPSTTTGSTMQLTSLPYNNNLPENYYTAYPNPSQGTFTLLIPALNGKGLLKITDNQGKTIYTEQVVTNGQPVAKTITIAQDGVFFIYIADDTQMYALTVIITH